MAKCEFCGKDMAFGIKVSHSHRRSNRTWKPNVKRVKAIVDGSPKHVYACHRASAAARSPAPSERRINARNKARLPAGLFRIFGGFYSRFSLLPSIWAVAR